MSVLIGFIIAMTLGFLAIILLMTPNILTFAGAIILLAGAVFAFNAGLNW